MATEESGASPESAAPATAEAPATESQGLFAGAAEEAKTPEPEQAETPEAQPTLTQEELEEIEHEGEKFKIPKKLKDAFYAQADYTRKTTELAQQRREFESQTAARQQMWQLQTQLQQQTLAEHAEAIAIDKALEQYKRVDWNALTASNPTQAITLEREMRNLQIRRQEVTQSIAQKQQQLAFQAQQEIARRTEQGQRELERDIKGWSPELQGKLMRTAMEFGYREDELAQINDPRAVRLLYEAYQYRQLMAKQAAKPPAAPLPKPVAKVGGGGATNAKSLSELTPEEYAAKRYERTHKRR